MTRYILNELLETEKSYIKDIEFLNLKYIQPILANPLVSPVDKRTLSECLPQLLKFQMKFAASLNLAVNDPQGYFKQVQASGRKVRGSTSSVSSLGSESSYETGTEGDPESLVEESVYDTLQIYKGWEQPPVHQLYRKSKMITLHG